MSIGLMSHVESKKWPCHGVDFRGLDPCCLMRNLVPTNTSNMRDNVQ